MSGPAVHPVAVRMVYQSAQAVKIPIIGMGGIQTAEDAIEMILAGATAVSVGTANFYHPHATEEIVDGIRAYMERYQVEDIRELIGACLLSTSKEADPSDHCDFRCQGSSGLRDCKGYHSSDPLPVRTDCKRP